MIADRRRSNAFFRALQAAVRPGDVVLDIGTGVGTFAVAACRFGAARVYAIEPDNVISNGPVLAKANGCEDRITFIHGLSTDVDLPERADVIISDLRGMLPFLQGHIPSIVDARTRFLKPGGTLIAQRDEIWAAPVEAPERYADFTRAWEQPVFGLDLTSLRSRSVQEWTGVHLDETTVIGEPQMTAELDYRTITDPNMLGTVRSVITRDGVIHGIALWFDCHLAPGISFSAAPGPKTIYGQVFFPLAKPVEVRGGELFEATIRAVLHESKYIWSWSSAVRALDGVTRASATQSTMANALPPIDTLRRGADSFVPHLSRAGQADRDILISFDGAHSLREIAHHVAARYPDQFVGWKEAFTRVAQLSHERAALDGTAHT